MAREKERFGSRVEELEGRFGGLEEERDELEAELDEARGERKRLLWTLDELKERYERQQREMALVEEENTRARAAAQESARGAEAKMESKVGIQAIPNTHIPTYISTVDIQGIPNIYTRFSTYISAVDIQGITNIQCTPLLLSQLTSLRPHSHLALTSPRPHPHPRPDLRWRTHGSDSVSLWPPLRPRWHSWRKNCWR